jgi:hypothetical protein
VTDPDPELNPDAEPVIVAVPIETPTSYGADVRTEPLATVSDPEGRVTTFSSDEVRITVMAEPALAGKPAESRVSTKSVPLAPGFRI